MSITLLESFFYFLINKGLNMDATLITTICSVFIATCALIVSLQQTILAREHNKLSVKPLISDVMHRGFSEKEFTYDIKNNGLGSAVITSFQFIWDEEEITSSKLFEKIQQSLSVSDEFELGQFGENSTLAKDEVKKLVYIRVRQDVSSDNASVRYTAIHDDLLGNLRVHINYQSMYGDNLFFETNISTIQDELKLLTKDGN
tara:strand:- start:10711 stop:11316 length:606 start_codon:yes stop_codon:yes gene_type:complete